ncbi:MAG: Clp protease N-terminal domain-containing protein, partial [Hyphomonadaceae bacterium]
MATFSRTLEHTLRRALSLATDHSHEYVTLEHLLMSLVDDDDAAGVLL